MRGGSRLLGLLASILWYLSAVLSSATVYAQSDVPTADQLDGLLAPVALYPDALVAQICAAATDPQQILDADAWLQQNLGLTGQARTDAAQAKGFDPAFIALVNFPQVMDMMAQNIDNYAAIGRAFSANQGSVMDSIQRLRQQAYAAGNLQSNDYQTVAVQNQGSVQAVTIVPANPQIVYVPQYNPQVVYVTPDPSAAIATSILTFGAGIALGAWIAGNSQPWGWGGWGWSWGHRTVIVHNHYWVVSNRYHPPRPYYHYRPPVYGPPIYVRPPPNWHDRPYYRPPPGGRPPGGPGGKPPPGIYPPPGGKPPGGGPGGKPPGGGSGGKPPRPEINPLPGGKPPGGGSPGSNPSPGTGPGGGTPGARPPTGVTPQPKPAVRPSTPTARPAVTPTPRPATPSVTRPQPRPAPYAGYPGKSPSASNAGARPSAFGGAHNTSADRAATNRGRASVASQQRQPQTTGGQRK